MRWTRKPMLRSLPILLLLMSTMLSAASLTEMPLATSPPQSTISTDDCVATCETDCEIELTQEREKLEAQCEAEQMKAVASERRHYEPLLAARTAERDHYRGEAAFWRGLVVTLGIIAVGIAACAAFC